MLYIFIQRKKISCLFIVNQTGSLNLAPQPTVYGNTTSSSSASLNFSHTTPHADGNHSVTLLNYTVTKLHDVHDMSDYSAILAVDCTSEDSLVFSFDNETTASVFYMSCDRMKLCPWFDIFVKLIRTSSIDCHSILEQSFCCLHSWGMGLR